MDNNYLLSMRIRSMLILLLQNVVYKWGNYNYQSLALSYGIKHA